MASAPSMTGLASLQSGHHDTPSALYAPVNSTTRFTSFWPACSASAAANEASSLAVTRVTLDDMAEKLREARRRRASDMNVTAARLNVCALTNNVYRDIPNTNVAQETMSAHRRGDGGSAAHIDIYALCEAIVA